jgi:hypothetical protein
MLTPHNLQGTAPYNAGDSLMRLGSYADTILDMFVKREYHHEHRANCWEKLRALAPCLWRGNTYDG